MAQTAQLLYTLQSARRISDINDYLSMQDPAQQVKKSYFQIKMINDIHYTAEDCVSLSNGLIGRIVNIFETYHDEKFVMVEKYSLHGPTTVEFCVADYSICKVNEICGKVKICDTSSEFDSYQCIGNEQKKLCQLQRKKGKLGPIQKKYTNQHRMNTQKQAIKQWNQRFPHNQIQIESQQKQQNVSANPTTNSNKKKKKIDFVILSDSEPNESDGNDSVNTNGLMKNKETNKKDVAASSNLSSTKRIREPSMDGFRTKIDVRKQKRHRIIDGDDYKNENRVKRRKRIFSDCENSDDEKTVKKMKKRRLSENDVVNEKQQIIAKLTMDLRNANATIKQLQKENAALRSAKFLIEYPNEFIKAFLDLVKEQNESDGNELNDRIFAVEQISNNLLNVNKEDLNLLNLTFSKDTNRLDSGSNEVSRTTAKNDKSQSIVPKETESKKRTNTSEQAKQKKIIPIGLYKPSKSNY